MRATKRGLLLGAGGVLLAAPAALIALRAELAIYDRRIPESVAFAAEAKAAGARLFDIAEEEARHWRNVRGGLRAPLVGLTRWSDWTILRGALEAQRLRVHREIRLDYSTSAPTPRSVFDLLAGIGAARAIVRGARSTTLFAWRVA
jgi:hypothetical protein